MDIDESHTTVDCASTAQELLAAAKFGIPEGPASHVQRPRLMNLLSRADNVPLVLVSAPAGTGKTTLVADWVRRSAAQAVSTGWVTFDEGDTAFWGLLLECLGRLGVDVPPGVSADHLLGRRRLMELAEAITEKPKRWTLVLDGYELVSRELAGEIDFLVRRTFGHLCLVFVGRVDPALALYRYRLSRQMVEIRVDDLAFTDDEAYRLLRCDGVRLSRESVHDLNERMRGWVAGLRIAARALAGREDVEVSTASVIAQAGDINEYLLGEVLEVQTPEIRRFLLYTCVPDVLCRGLVEELAGAKAVRILAELLKSNAFIEPLSDQPDSFRYYPFFRDLLRAQLACESPQVMAELHLRAAGWFQRHGLADQSIAHLAAIAAWDRVAVQIVNDSMIGRLLLEGAGGTLSDLGRQLPPDLEHREACVVRAAVALVIGDWAACSDELSRARRSSPADAAREDAALLSISVLGALSACFADDAKSARTLAEEAEQALAWAQPSFRTSPGSEMYALVQFSHGVALLRCGEVEHARRELMSAAESDAGRAFPLFRADCLGHVALVDALEGYLARGSRTAVESLVLAADAGVALEERPSSAHAALARIGLERYDLSAARRHSTFVMASRSPQCERFSRGIAESVMAGLERTGGRLQPALARLDAASKRAARTDPWMANWLRVEAAKLSVASGSAELALEELSAIEDYDDPQVALVAAAAYAETGQEPAVERSLARAHYAQSPPGAQVSRLLAEFARESRRQSPGRARVVLDRSLKLAATEQLRRPFREAGPSVRRLLVADPRLLADHKWLSQSTATLARPGSAGGSETGRSTGPESSVVVDALTAKELEVLGRLEELLTTEQIAEKMFVTVNTVRSHVRSILRKLGVTRRNAAIRKARELGLLDGDPRRRFGAASR